MYCRECDNKTTEDESTLCDKCGIDMNKCVRCVEHRLYLDYMICIHCAQTVFGICGRSKCLNPIDIKYNDKFCVKHR